MSVLLPVLGVARTTVSFFRAIAILRLLRGCKYFFLKPIWLMLVKATGSLVSVTNLVMFNTMITVMYYNFGRFLYLDTLNNDNRYNFSNILVGYMTLITIMTGDGWSSIMYRYKDTRTSVTV